MKTTSSDAIDLLTDEHQEVANNFEKFAAMSDRAKVGKKKLADEICHALLLHMKIEEEIFYPAAREVLQERDLMDEALIEHSGAKVLIEQIMLMEPGDELYDMKMKVLSEQIEHHVQEEEGEMFRSLRKTSLDMKVLAQEMLALKEESEHALAL